MDGGSECGFRSGALAWLLLVLVVAGHASLTLTRFGGANAVTSDDPVIAGRHPLHLYHARLGAETFRQRYSTACYDPTFQAGYPKTPVFDGGCRPAEFFLLLAGSNQTIAAYKIGLFAICLFVPAAFVLAGRGLGLSVQGSCIAAALGSTVWWTQPVQTLFSAGDVDLLLAGLCAIVFVSWLSRYHWDPCPSSWLILALTSIVGWYAHPVIWIGLSPVVVLYYIAAAPRHGPAWHLGLAGICFAGIAPNMWWLWDWGRFWWLRQPSVDDIAPFPTWGAMLGSTSENHHLFGTGPFGLAIVLGGLVACLVLFAMKHRSAPFLLVVTGFLTALASRLGVTWMPFVNGSAARAAPFVAALAALPLAGVLSIWARRAIIGKPVTIALCMLPALIASFETLRILSHANVTPIAMGLKEDPKQFVSGILQHTDDSARILLEDIAPGTRVGWNWPALLPTVAPRSYLGGLDPDAKFEHFHVGLKGCLLNGRALSNWSDSELSDLVRRYNIGWIAARSPEVAARWLALPMAKEVARFHDGGEVVLVALARKKSYILTGEAKWEQADRRKVVLTDVIPADAPHPDGGPNPAKVIVLSLHHQPGLKVSPNIVLVERDPDPYDPIPMIRLRMTSPLSRIVISWENR